MRNKLIKLLRKFEEEDGFKCVYNEYIDDYQCEYKVEDFLEFPNYKIIHQHFNSNLFEFKDDGLIRSVPSNGITAELKRMESDGLIMISAQEGTKYAYAIGNNGPDYDDGVKFTCESIILTTKGKSNWRYFIHKFSENPETTALSLAAIIISIIALFL